MDINEPLGRIALFPCDDVKLLAKLCAELTEDEANDVHPTEAVLCDNISALLSSGEVAYTFQAEGRVVGYAMVNVRRSPFYLHYFYICRDARRHGYGTEAFHALLKTLGTSKLDLDVFVWNERGKAFWQSLGFTPRATIMRYQADHDHN